MFEKLCLLLEDSSLTSLSTCLESLEWRAQVLDLSADNKLIPTALTCTIGIIHSHELTRNPLSKLRLILSQLSDIEWILITSENAIRDNKVQDFVCQNCSFYLTENTEDPLSASILKPQLKVLLDQELRISLLRKKQSNGSGFSNKSHHELLAGLSDKMQKLLKCTDKAAQVDAPVLIVGESGTGKELVARTIHNHSSRKHQPFVAINCGAIPESLIQSELFGYEQGAFTGASKRHIGKLEQAQHGTLFLDEIAELPTNLQVNLLRFLQEKTIERLGGDKSIELDVRIVAATHENLESAVTEDTFREDLYYRLAVLVIEPPPLRKRNEDIQSLAKHFLEEYTPASDSDTAPITFSDDALSAMTSYSWPGNVRELMNRIQSAVIMSDDHIIKPKDLGLSAPSIEESSNILNFSERKTLPLEATKRLAEIRAIKQALKEHNHNISQASRKLEISRASMYRLMQKYELG